MSGGIKMNESIVKEISTNLNITENQVNVTLQMLSEGNTIPFIARYRKDKTGGLTEEEIKVIGAAYEYQVNLLKRKEDVIRLIDEKGLLLGTVRNDIDYQKSGHWDKSYINSGYDEAKTYTYLNNTIANVSSVVFQKKSDIDYKKLFADALKYRQVGEPYRVVNHRHQFY